MDKELNAIIANKINNTFPVQGVEDRLLIKISLFVNFIHANFVPKDFSIVVALSVLVRTFILPKSLWDQKEYALTVTVLKYTMS